MLSPSAIMRSTPLPPVEQLPTNTTPDFRSVYQIVLTAESEAVDGSPSGALNRMDARVVGYLLTDLWNSKHLLGSNPVHHVLKEVASASDIRSVIRIGAHYREKLLRACEITFPVTQTPPRTYNVHLVRQSKGPLPHPNNHPSRPSFDTLQDMINDRLMASPKSHSTAKKWALARDSFRCLVTGKYDEESFHKAAEAVGPLAATAGTCPTECCHILGEATAQDLEDPRDPGVHKRQENAAGVLAILALFGLDSICDIFANAQIHHLCNILTLGSEVHTRFDNLRLWFEGTDTPNQYHVATHHSHQQMGRNLL